MKSGCNGPENVQSMPREVNFSLGPADQSHVSINRQEYVYPSLGHKTHSPAVKEGPRTGVSIMLPADARASQGLQRSDNAAADLHAACARLAAALQQLSWSTKKLSKGAI
eukprot:1149981-Pelagomonas_calceolata.AAC.1